MSIQIKIVGFKLPDDKWKKMKIIHDNCNDLDIEIPKEVEQFFEYKTPNDNGVEVDLKTYYLNDYTFGFEIRTSEIPKDVSVIHFIASQQ